jgi:hypothetical protein
MISRNVCGRQMLRMLGVARNLVEIHDCVEMPRTVNPSLRAKLALPTIYWTREQRESDAQ